MKEISSLTIFSESLQVNETYQFIVKMINQQNSSLQSFGYLFFEVKHHQSLIILIK